MSQSTKEHDMERTIVYDQAVDHYAVIGRDGYIMECFRTEEQAKAYLAEFEATQPKTAGENWDLEKKHGALFHD
jgi:hypothetical protein